jgi:hypothetical protein
MATRGGGGSMERMFGIIATMAQIQNQRKQLALQEKQAETQKEQFIQTLGFQQKSEQWKKFDKLYDRFLDASHEERDSGAELVAQMGFDPAETKILQNLIRNAPESLDSLKRTAATRGYRQGASASPLDQEVAATNMAGQTRGGLGTSGLQALLATSAQGQVTPFMGREFAQRAAGGNSVMEAGLGQQFALRPELMRNLANVQSGLGMTAAQTAQADIGRQGNEVGMAGVRQRGIEAEMNIAMQLATKKAAGMVTPEDINRTYGILSEKLKIMGDPKVGSGIRQQATAEYNSLVTRMGLNELIWSEQNKPTPASVLERLWRQTSPAQPQLPPARSNPMTPFVPRP